jgi:hypothetical protein
VRKYFSAASEDIIFLLAIKGIKDNRFTSNPIHAPNQVEEEIEIRDPKIIIEIKRSRVG